MATLGRTATPDVVESPSEHSLGDVERDLMQPERSAQHRRDGAPRPQPQRQLQVPSPDGDGDDVDSPPQHMSGRGVDDPRANRLLRGSSEVAELLSATEATAKEFQSALARVQNQCAAHQQRADAAELKVAQLTGLIERERGRHSASNLRAADLEAEVERLTRRIHDATLEADEREAQLRLAQQRVVEAQSHFDRVDAERTAGASSERKRAALLNDRVHIQDDEIQRLETLLAAANKSRDDAFRAAKTAQDDAAKSRREALQTRRDFDAFEARVHSGALVEVQQLYAAQHENQSLALRAQVAETNCERLLQLLAQTAEYGRLVQEDVLGTGYVFVHDGEHTGGYGGVAGVAAPRTYVPSTVSATVRDVVLAVNDSIHARGGGVSGRARSAHRKANGAAPLAATVPVIAVEKEHMYWIPRAAFDAAEAFRKQHLPTSLALSCFHHFFVELNAIWRERLDAKLKALAVFRDRHAATVAVAAGQQRAGALHDASSAALVDDIVAGGTSQSALTASMLLNEAVDIESLLRDVDAELVRLRKRAAIPRHVEGVLRSLGDRVEHAARVHRRAALEIRRQHRVIEREASLFGGGTPSVGAAAHAAASLNVSGADGPAAARASALEYLDNAIGAMRVNATVLRELGEGDAAQFTRLLRNTVDQARAGRAVSAPKCIDMLDTCASEVETLLMLLGEEASRIERRADSLAAAPLDAMAAARVAHR